MLLANSARNRIYVIAEQRCGHTLTSVHVGDQLLFVLYGGATDIESTKGNAEGGSKIRQTENEMQRALEYSCIAVSSHSPLDYIRRAYTI